MTFPHYADVELALLQEIARAGGHVKPKDVYTKVATHFPNLTPDDLQEKLSSGQHLNKWENVVQWARNTLCKKGHLARQARGVWTITPEGRARLGQPPPPSSTPKASNQPSEIAESIRESVDKLVKLANKAHGAPPASHDDLVKLGREIGEKLGKKVETETGPVYKHDVAWKDNQWKNPSLVMEICDKGVLDKDIQSLNWADKNWSARCILVTVDDRDYENALKKLGNTSPVHLMKAVDLRRLHSLVGTAGIGILKAIFAV